MSRFIIVVLLSCISCSLIAAEASKTDLTKEVFVEKSATDFTLKAEKRVDLTKKAVTWILSAPDAGHCTLICYVNGRAWRLQSVRLPGQFKMSVRGMAAGSYRITLQAVDSSGRVGSMTETLRVDQPG